MLLSLFPLSSAIKMMRRDCRVNNGLSLQNAPSTRVPASVSMTSSCRWPWHQPELPIMTCKFKPWKLGNQKVQKSQNAMLILSKEILKYHFISTILSGIDASNISSAKCFCTIASLTDMNYLMLYIQNINVYV